MPLAVRDRAPLPQVGVGLPPVLREMLGVMVEIFHDNSRIERLERRVWPRRTIRPDDIERCLVLQAEAARDGAIAQVTAQLISPSTRLRSTQPQPTSPSHS
jgi:hypothetical protein